MGGVEGGDVEEDFIQKQNPVSHIRAFLLWT